MWEANSDAYGKPPAICLCIFGQVKIGVGIHFGKSGDLFIGLFNVFLVELCFTGNGIDHREGGVSYITGLVIKDDGFVGIREGVFQALVAKIEFLVGRVTVEACKMGAKIAAKSRRRQIFSYRPPPKWSSRSKIPTFKPALAR